MHKNDYWHNSAIICSTFFRFRKKFQRKQFHRFPQNCKNETEHYVLNLDIKNQEVDSKTKNIAKKLANSKKIELLSPSSLKANKRVF